MGWVGREWMGWVGWEDEGGCCLRRSSAFLLNWRRGGRGAQLRSRVAKLRVQVQKGT